MKKDLVVLACVASTAWAAAAGAETPPSAWDVARDPAEAGRWDLHVRVERLLQGSFRMRGENELRLEAARVMLEDADAAHSPDVRLRFDLGVLRDRLGRLCERDAADADEPRRDRRLRPRPADEEAALDQNDIRALAHGGLGTNDGTAECARLRFQWL